MTKYDWKIKVRKPGKKHKHRGLKIFGIVLAVIIVLPIAFVFGAFYDTSTKKVSDSDAHYENIVSESFYKGLSNLGTDGKLNFTIDEEMIDGIMMGACDKINQKNFIPKMYCNIKGNNYTFIMDVKASFFKTRLLLNTKLEGTDTEFLIFKINKITIGRLPIPTNWITGLITKFISDDKLNEVFANTGFHIKSDIKHSKLTYSREQFKEDVGNYVQKLGKDNPYLEVLLNFIGDKNVLTTNYKDGVTAIFDLTKLQPSPEIIENAPLDFNSDKTALPAHQQNITTWLNKGYLEEKDVAKVFSYLIRGYNCSSTDAKKFIDDLDQESELYKAIEAKYGTPSSYPGTKCADDKDFETYNAIGESGKAIDAEFTPDTAIPPQYATFSIVTDSLNKFLAREMNEAIGMTIPVTYQNTDKQWCFEYIFIDNLFADFKYNSSTDVEMNMHLSLNVTGEVPICLTIRTDSIELDRSIDPDNNIGKLKLDLEDKMYFGKIEMSDLSLLDEVFKGIGSTGVFTYYFDEATNQRSFLIDIDSIVSLTDIEKAAVISILNTPYNYEFQEDTSGEGKLMMKFTKSA